MDNPKFENDDGERPNPVVNNRNLQLNHEPINNDDICKYHNIY